MFSKSIRTLAIIATIWTHLSIAYKDYDVLKFEITLLPGAPLSLSLTMKRDENRQYKFNVTLNITDDDLSIYDVEANIYRSAIGNNNFVLSPFKIPRKSLCSSLTNEYRAHIMDDITKYSNLPNNHDRNVDYCDLLKRNYQYKIVDYSASVDSAPKFTPTGTYKCILNLIDRKTDQIVGYMLAMTRLY